MSEDTPRSGAKPASAGRTSARKSPGSKSPGSKAQGTKASGSKAQGTKASDGKTASRTAAGRKNPAGRTDTAGGGRRTGIAVWLSGPLMSFHLVLSVTALLALSGLVMVLSASSVASYAEGGSAYSMFNSQLMYSVIGAIFFYLALRIPIDWIRRFSPAAIGVSVLLLMLVLVPGIGTEVQGARRWIDVGPFGLQPSELMKLSLAIWGAHILTRSKTMPGPAGDPRLRLGAVSLLTFVLVMRQPNLSTTIALALIVAALLWFSGLRARWFVGLAAVGALGALILALTSGYRAKRIQSFLNPSSDPLHGGYQALQAKFSLADGGLFGRGPGQSRSKWNYLPNSHNDFIFAIIGEELGLIGCLVVIVLFVLFAYAGMRIMLRSADPFLRLLVAAITVWTVAQAFINIGYVVGLLPVTGLQLPLISAGGSSTTITLAAFGLMANAARHEPEAVAALRSGRESRLPPALRLPLPRTYRPERTRRGASANGGERARWARQQIQRDRNMGGRAGAARGTGQARSAQARSGQGRPAQARAAQGRSAQGRSRQASPGRGSSGQVPQSSRDPGRTGRQRAPETTYRRGSTHTTGHGARGMPGEPGRRRGDWW